MQITRFFTGRQSAHRRGKAVLMGATLLLGACGAPSSEPEEPQVNQPPPEPEVVRVDSTFDTAVGTARFLSRATFGPTPQMLDTMVGTSASEWFVQQVSAAPSLHLPYVLDFQNIIDREDPRDSRIYRMTPEYSFWIKAVTAEDQLRQRMAFALSQILVTSNLGSPVNNPLRRHPEGMAYYQDILVANAFGNYRDILEEVTYSPAMGSYLTYMGNEKADPETGRMPDENYAREILQLFTLGLVELNRDGTPRTGADGDAIELYDNDDIVGLARVFTGLDENEELDENDIGGDEWMVPMEIFEDRHESGAKTFLGMTIPEGTLAADSITLALDHIFDHPNVGPFLARQLIQRFVTSHPQPAYVGRVADVFDSGSFTLPDGTVVGTGVRGDLEATLAAILFDDAAISEAGLDDPTFGKVREPVIRLTNLFRAFNVQTVLPVLRPDIHFTGDDDDLAQQPFGSPSVFNFYRPGFVAPGTLTGAEGLTMPELQLVNTSSVPGYSNFIDKFADATVSSFNRERIQRLIDKQDLLLDVELEQTALVPDYSDIEDLAINDLEGFIDELDRRLTYGQLSDGTRQAILAAVERFRFDPDGDRFEQQLDNRISWTITLIMSSPDYLVQR